MRDTNERLTEVEYREHIETMADVVEEITSEEYGGNGDIHDAIHEEVDNSSWITYYSRNLDVLRHSENKPEEWQHLVPNGAGYEQVIQVMAFEVLRQDLSEELSDRGVGL